MKTDQFGLMPDGQEIHQYTLQGHGLTARFINYGAVLQDLRLEGHRPALVLGFEDLDSYLKHSPYFGAIAGRYANRIKDGKIELGGKQYQLDRNYLGKHCLHGGAIGIGKRVWRVEDLTSSRIKLAIDLQNNEMGFPGNMVVEVIYELLPGGTLDIKFSAKTDQATLCNLAHHSYFNLDGAETILNHQLQVEAEHYTPVDQELIPTGEILSVENTAFDFSDLSEIGSGKDSHQRATRQSLDHNFCLSNERTSLRQVATLKSQTSQISMNLLTTEPGLQIYCGAGINCPVNGLDQRRMGANAGVAMEPQIWPDSINQPGFPQAILHPEENYFQNTQYVFQKTTS